MYLLKQQTYHALSVSTKSRTILRFTSLLSIHLIKQNFSTKQLPRRKKKIFETNRIGLVKIWKNFNFIFASNGSVARKEEKEETTRVRS